MSKAIQFTLLGLLAMACVTKKKLADLKPGTYAYDVAFLQKYQKQIIELTDDDGDAKVLLSAEYQGRVLSSTSGGDEGTSYGWLNYDLLASGEKRKQFNPIGGEERFWLGPEGGQFSLYFPARDSFHISRWQVPQSIDTDVYDIADTSDTQVTFVHEAIVSNYSNTLFQFRITRTISLLSQDSVENEFQTILPADVKFVAYQSANTIKNVGLLPWERTSGLPSIWLLGMFTPSPATTVIIPFHPGDGSKEKITTTYFGEIPADRLTIRDSVLFFSCDGKFRSKIGLPPSIAKPVAASFDADRNILTVIHFEVDPRGAYVNSKWEVQQNPFEGDVVNSYNDGPLGDGSQLGPFYELESSSVALALKAGEAKTYKQATAHFEGSFEALNKLAMALLGVDLTEIRK